MGFLAIALFVILASVLWVMCVHHAGKEEPMNEDYERYLRSRQTADELDRRLVQKGLLKEGQTTDLTASCMWTVTGEQEGKLYKTCTLHGEHKVVAKK